MFQPAVSLPLNSIPNTGKTSKTERLFLRNFLLTINKTCEGLGREGLMSHPLTSEGFTTHHLTSDHLATDHLTSEGLGISNLFRLLELKWFIHRIQHGFIPLINVFHKH